MGSALPEAPSPPLRIAASVALVAAAMLLLEIVVTRLFSVLFFYHFSFFAISLVMSGLVLGGLVAARSDATSMSVAAFERRLSALALTFAVCAAVALAIVVTFPLADANAPPDVFAVTRDALVFLPGLVAAGAFLATAFARRPAWIGALYAWDLVGAALACVASIGLLRILPGPAVLVLPALLAAVAGALLDGARTERVASAGVAALLGALLVVNARTNGDVLRLRTSGAGATRPILERWNEHSRIQAFEFPGLGRYLVIDRSAGTLMRKIARQPDGTVATDPAWSRGPQYAAYRVGRVVKKAAIIGVGGGADLLPPLYYGATQVDGYELNQILIDLLERDFSDFNALTSRPEVHLHHTEARVGITHSHQQYDVIQASLIDTWAATANGGFVLSENGLYTRQGWQAFIDHLSASGILTMTRWYIPDAPAETERLVALAATALADAGFPDASRHLVLIQSKLVGVRTAFTGQEGRGSSTVLVSKQPFTAEELARLRASSSEDGMEVVAAFDHPPTDPTLRGLMDPTMRAGTIAQSRYDIAPPTDSRPYFFLQIRPSDLVNLSRQKFGSVTEITFNGVRVMMILAAGSLALVAFIAALSLAGAPGVSSSRRDVRVYRRMTLYFLGIGFGYILVQLGLHQRLTLVLGHPTLSLSVVLFSMLLGTGAGAASSERLFPAGRLAHAGLAIVGAVVLLLAIQPLVPLLALLDSAALRIAIVGFVVSAVGFALGLAFPLGVRRVALTGERAVQKMWALNGAASIAASVLAAVLGLSFGSTAVLGAALVAYAVATAAGAMADRVAPTPVEP